MIEANAACNNLDRAGYPNVVDAPIHPWPIGMRHRAIVVGKRRKRGRRRLRHTETTSHQGGGGRVESCVEISADDARGYFLASIHPRQQLLNLEQPKRIVAARHVEMGYVNIQRYSADEDAGNQREYRRRQGFRCLTIELRETEIDALIRRGLLKAETRHDMDAVRLALYQYLDHTLTPTS